MTFLAPAILAGLSVAAVPVAIHLLNKMRVQVVRWGATRFLQESIKKNQRRLQIEDLILLALRCLLIALLALAFARPVIHPGSIGEGTSEGPEITVLLIDQSASMGQSNGIETRYDLAKTAARKILDGMGRGSQAALFLVTDRVTQIVAHPTSNLALVRRAVDVSAPTDRTSDILPGVRLAFDALKPFSGKKKIVIFTDNQAVAWQQLVAIKSLAAETPGVQLQVVPLGEQGEDNLAITALKPESLLCATGQLFGCFVEVRNFGSTPATGVRVTLSLNNDVPADEAVIEKIEPGQSKAVRLNVRFALAGFQTLKAAIPPDRLPVDNERALAVQVIDQIRATIVEGSNPASKNDRDAYFLANALMPVPPARRADYYLKAEAVPASWIETADLTRNDLIFLANVGRPSPAASQKLRQFVNEGGALIIFPGPNVQPDDYNNEPSLREILPAKLGAIRDPGKANGFAIWQGNKYPHPITAMWNDASNGTLGSVRATKYFPLTLVPPKSGPAAEKDIAQVIVNYADGTPAVVERTVGKGHVVLFSSTATSQWNTLAIHPNFVPFLQRLTGYVSNRETSGSLTLAPGGVFQQTVEIALGGREFSVVPPDAKSQSRPGGRIELLNRDAVVRYHDTEKAGAYRLFISGNDLPFAAFAVQSDPKESNLKTVTPKDLAGLGMNDKLSTAQAGAANGGVRREFWGLLVLLAGIVALVEMLLAHRFSLAK